MAIYDIFEHEQRCVGQDEESNAPRDLSHHHSELVLGRSSPEQDPESKSQFFSSLAARLFFFMLFIVNITWSFYAAALFVISLLLNCFTGFQLAGLHRFHRRRYLNFKRSLVCGIALLVALFSPALGTMFACTYFLMYDKKGIEEVVPTVLQDQFREFFT